MPTELDVRIQKDIRRIINLNNWSNPVAVTLTFKKSILSNNGKFDIRTVLDEEKASENVRFFINFLNRKSLGNLPERVGMKIRVFSVYEKTDTKHLHYHCVIDRPSHVDEEKFSELIINCWKSTWWGNKEINIQTNADNGWVSYITKFFDKENFADSIDWKNVHY